MEFYRIPDEYNLPPEDGLLTSEYPAAAPEDAPAPREIPELPEEFAFVPEQEAPSRVPKKDSGAKKRKKQRELIRSIMAPVAATVATLSIVLASYNSDPLADNIVTETYESSANIISNDTPTPTPTPTEAPAPEYLNYPEGSVPAATEKILTVIHASNEPDYIFASSPCETEEEAMAEVKAWLKTWGGNPKFLPETSRTKTWLGYQLSDDAIISGSGDSPERIVVLGGAIYAVYQVDIYCDAYLRSHAEGYYEFGDAVLPVLPNLDPDFAGEMAWNDDHYPEQYVRMALEGDRTYRYLEMGSAWSNYYGAELGDVPGATYDPDTNVLTLENCTAAALDINLMGNGFTINLIGDNHIGYISAWGAMYGGSITFAGTGSLTVNESQTSEFGLVLNAEHSPSALIVKGGVEIEIYGSSKAVHIEGSTLDNPIRFLADHTLLAGGVRKTEETIASDGTSYYDATVVIPDGTPATFVGFESLD